jgi:hypothetical protein
VNIAVRVEPADETPPEVEYRWDVDTDILTANFGAGGGARGVVAGGMSGSVEVEGSDGSWLVFDVAAGRIHGVEVAVWPDVRKVSSLAPPAAVEDGRVLVPARAAHGGGGRSGGGAAIAALEVDTALMAEADPPERTIHFRLGGARQTRAVRIASDILLDIDHHERLAGVWLLNVPPFPADT